MTNFFPLETDPPQCADKEPHFRRGFHHGAISIIQALKEGHSLNEMEAFVDAEIRAWREDSSTPAFPPTPLFSNR